MLSKRISGTALLVLCLWTAMAMAERPKPEVHGEFQGDEMYTLLPPDGIPAIMDPEYLTGSAAAAQMSPAEPVMALATEGDAVCWSTWQLDHHEIVNDTFDGVPVAVTW